MCIVVYLRQERCLLASSTSFNRGGLRCLLALLLLSGALVGSRVTLTPHGGAQCTGLNETSRLSILRNMHSRISAGLLRLGRNSELSLTGRHRWLGRLLWIGWHVFIDLLFLFCLS